MLVIPAFAVGRTQSIVWLLRKLEQDGRIPALPTYVDSPLAMDATEIYLRHPEDHDLGMETLLNHGHNPLKTREYQLARTRDESRVLGAEVTVRARIETSRKTPASWRSAFVTASGAGWASPKTAPRSRWPRKVADSATSRRGAGGV